MKELSKKISSNVVKARRNQGINQEKMAYMCGIQKGYLSEIESGKKLPSLEVLNKIAESLKIDIKDFF